MPHWATAKDKVDGLGSALVSGFQLVALFVIGATIFWTAVHDYVNMIKVGRAGLDDILLLFIYLELGTMVGIYFKTDRLPVLFLLYVAMTAMTRYLAVDIKTLPIEHVVIVTGGIFVLALAVLVLQIAAQKQEPSVKKTRSGHNIGPGPAGHA
jgi:phosphate starvation-inducible membrane PsiE